MTTEVEFFLAPLPPSVSALLHLGNDFRVLVESLLYVPPIGFTTLVASLLFGPVEPILECVLLK
jgi:hypothetical protein